MKTTLFPITLAGQRLGVRMDPPTLGSHTDQLLAELGYAAPQIAQWKTRAVVA